MAKIGHIKDFILKVITAFRDDFTMQTVAITVPSILGSIIFTSLYALAAIWSRSMWLVMMTFFYIVTILMKISILVAAGKNLFSWSKDNSSAVSYRKFSWYLLMFDIALGIVVGIFHIIGFHKEYPGYTIYAAAIFVIGKIYDQGPKDQFLYDDSTEKGQCRKSHSLGAYPAKRGALEVWTDLL